MDAAEDEVSAHINSELCMNLAAMYPNDELHELTYKVLIDYAQNIVE